MTKKLSAIILAVIISLAVIPTNSFATESEMKFYHKEYITDENGVTTEKILDRNGNEVSFDEQDDSQSASFGLQKHEASSAVKATALPSQWDSRNNGWITDVKTQAFGTCWAFATCASAESSLIAQGYETKDSVDLSEAHLVRFRDGYIEGSSNQVNMDKYNIYPTMEYNFDYGGNYEDAIATLSRGSGFTNEIDYPFSSNVNDMNFSDSEMFAHNYDLVSAKFFTNTDDVKAAIMETGAVSTAMYYSNIYFKTINPSEYTYYQSSQTGINHGITIIGWDDNYPASNFRLKPADNGAWLIKNSWGTSYNYFWLSYYDPSVTSFCQFIAKPTENLNTYQYNGIYEAGSISYGATTYSANIFTANKNEKVTKAGFLVPTEENYTCTVYLYNNLKNTTNPTSGTLCESKTVTIDKQGYYTVDFDKEYDVSANSKFSVVVKFKTPTKTYAYVTLEYLDYKDFATYHVEKGQSFVGSSLSKMTDVCNIDSAGNVAIKAYTKNETAVTSVNITQLPKTEFYTNDSFTYSGLTVDAELSDGTTISDIAYTVTAPDMKTAGVKTVTVSCQNCSATYNIYVMDRDAIIGINSGCVDYENHTVSGLDAGIDSGIDSLDNYIKTKDGYSYKCSFIGTGNEITVLKDNEYIGRFYVLIYGDVNGDGMCDGMDSIIVSCLANGMMSKEDVSGAVYTAADCNRDGVINDLDVSMLSDAGLLLAQVEQTNSK